MGSMEEKHSKKKDFWVNKKVLVTGGHGFLGRFVIEELRKRGAKQIFAPQSSEFDLRVRKNCETVVHGMDIVIHLAAQAGGIGLNRERPAELFYNNAIMGIELIEAARKAGVKKTVIIGTICAYPKYTPVPFKEEDLWDGYPEETNAAYGLAKKMLLVQSQAYRQQYGTNAIYLLPVNLYGPYDNFDPKDSHVIPALIRKISEAKNRGSEEVVLWGTGKPTREFLYVKDAAEGIVLAAERYDGVEPVNLGSGMEISIRDLAYIIMRLVGFKGRIVYDTSKPDGQPRRRLDTTRAKDYFGFKAKTDFETGLKETIGWFTRQHARVA